METKHKDELKEAIKLIEFAMEKDDVSEIHFTLMEAHKIFMNTWTVYIDYVLQDLHQDE